MWWKRALFWGLMPVAAPQGLAARRRAPRFAPAAGPDRGVIRPAAAVQAPGRAPLRVLGLGDSIIEGVGCATLEEAFVGRFAAALALATARPVEWRALGRTGACAAEMVEHLLPRIDGAMPDLVVISVGVNDVSTLKRSARFRHDLAALLDGLRAQAPGALLVLCGLPQMQRFPLLPQPLRWLAGLRAQTFDVIAARVAAARDGVLHEPTLYFPEPHEFAPDGYHPNAATQGLWAEVLVGKIAGHVAAASPVQRAGWGLTAVAD